MSNPLEPAMYHYQIKLLILLPPETFTLDHSQMRHPVALQMKSFGPNNFQISSTGKKCHFGNFSEWAGMAEPCYVGPQQSLTGIEKLFLSWVPMNI